MTEHEFTNELQQSLKKQNTEKLAGEYWRQDEFLHMHSFLPGNVLSALQQELPLLQNVTHRTNLPGVRKGGSVGATGLKKETTYLRMIYSSPAILNFLSAIVTVPLLVCPEDDEHAMALYSYTEEGDFIHYHYDTSFYKGNRYTVLITIENNSSCNLVYDLYTKSKHRSPEHNEVNTAAGSLVMFNGNKLYHAVSPALKNEQRHVLSLEYLDNQKIGKVGRLISVLKDRIAYFGIRSA